MKNITYMNFNRELSKKGRLILSVRADWCRNTAEIISVLEKIEGVEVGIIDADSEPELTDRLKITEIPAFLLLADGEIIARAERNQTPDTIISELGL